MNQTARVARLTDFKEKRKKGKKLITKRKSNVAIAISTSTEYYTILKNFSNLMKRVFKRKPIALKVPSGQIGSA